MESIADAILEEATEVANEATIEAIEDEAKGASPSRPRDVPTPFKNVARPAAQ